MDSPLSIARNVLISGRLSVQGRSDTCYGCGVDFITFIEVEGETYEYEHDPIVRTNRQRRLRAILCTSCWFTRLNELTQAGNRPGETETVREVTDRVRRMPSSRASVLWRLDNERERQLHTKGFQESHDDGHSPYQWLAYVMHELGDAVHQHEIALSDPDVTNDAETSGWELGLVKAAATIVAALEAIERKRSTK